ncbi:MAG: ABC transporter ATP-binding protein [Acidimicrobiales bacterium]|nr:ABC transporter ATP-binding protein [Acidimicrobiales bacterium]
MLQVDGLTKRYGELLALDDVSLTVRRGEIVGFLGPNGAGKTTTMRAIMQLVAMDRGTVTWDGRPVDLATRRRFGYMPAERGMYARMRVRDHLVYYGRLSGRSASTAAASTDRWLERLGLTGRADDEIQTLSSGNQQRVQFALAMLDEPDLLVLDEPFAGLDPIAVDTLSDLLREEVARGTALLLSSHQLDLVAEVCSGVVIVDDGRVVLRGEVSELRSASTSRVVAVEFATVTPWDTAHGRVESDDGRRYRVHVAVDTDPEVVIAEARARGDVIGYGFSPPDLSEIFLAAVGRDHMEPAVVGGEVR